MKPATPLLTPSRARMKPATPLLAHNAAKSSISREQRCHRFHPTTKTGPQRCQRFQPGIALHRRGKQCTRAYTVARATRQCAYPRSAMPLRNAIRKVRPRPIIPHAIPTQPNPASTQNPQNSNDQTSNHETHSRELHAKLPLGGGLARQHTDTPTDWRPPRGLRGLAGLRADAPSEARGADGERAGRHPPAHTATRRRRRGGRRRDRRARAGFEARRRTK